MRDLWMAILVCGVLFAPIALAQTVVPIGGDFQVNSDPAGSQFKPEVVPRPDGLFLVVWDVFCSLPSQPCIRRVDARRYDLNAGAIAGQFQVATRGRYHYGSTAAFGVGGGFMVVWQEGFDADIFGRFYSPNFNPRGPILMVNTADFGSQRQPAVAPLPDDGFVVVWHDEPADDDPSTPSSGDPFVIKGKRYLAGGAGLSEFRVSQTEVSGFNLRPQVASSGDGFVVTWTSDDVYGMEGASGLQARRFDVQGQPVGGQFRVDSDAFRRRGRSALAMHSDGSFVVVWESGSSASTDIRVQRFSSDGSRLGGDFQANAFTTGARSNSEIAIDEDGNFVIVWDSDFPVGSDSSARSVHLRAFNANALALEPEIQVNSHTTGDQVRPNVAAGSDGTFIVTWEGYGSSGNDEDRSIQGRRYALVDDPCVDSASSLCLNDSRFKVEVEWRDFEGRRGTATAVPAAADDSGLFWFFSQDNWELLVKVLNGCPLNRHFWVFAAATTDVEYTLSVTDTLTGVSTSYFNPLGNPAAAITDTGALEVCGPMSSLGSPPAPKRKWVEPFTTESTVASTETPDGCSVGPENLCLNGGRFKLEIEWENVEGTSGVGRRVPLGTDDSGLFWFFSADNWEILVKVLDGCSITDHFWVFAAASTDVGYTLIVTDTETGLVKEYRNPVGLAAPAIIDTSAFAVCG